MQKQKDSWKESCKLSNAHMSWSSPILIYCLSSSVRAVIEHSPLALRVKNTQGKDSWKCKPSQAKSGDKPELPAFCTSKLFGLSHKTGLIHSVDSVWAVKRGLQAVDPHWDGSSFSVALS